MTLEEEIRLAIKNSAKSLLPELKKRAEREKAPLLAAGNKNYPAILDSLLSELEQVTRVSSIAEQVSDIDKTTARYRDLRP